MESAMSGVFSAEVYGACFRLGRFASPTQAHPRGIGDVRLFTYEHLRISIRCWGATLRLQECFEMFKRVQQTRSYEFKLRARKYQ
jgi:hypothetical protein